MYCAVYPLPGNSVYWFVLCFFLSVAKAHLFNISEGGRVTIIV